ncbi:MAG: (Fe-S)-binding protein [Bacillota bacterium]
MPDPEQRRICALCPNMCRWACPVARTERLQTTSPAGKAFVTYMIDRGGLPLSPDSASAAYACAACRRCLEECPSQVDLPRLLEQTRAVCVAAGQAPPEVCTFLAGLRANHCRQPAPDRMKWRNFIRPGARTLYFTGCSAPVQHPDMVTAALDLLSSAGVEVDMPGEEWCCGQPAAQLGDNRLFTEMAEHNAKIFNSGNYDLVFSSCPMCTYTFRENYPAAGFLLNPRVLHTTELIGELHAAGRLKFKLPAQNTAVGYHDPCFLGRYQKIYDIPRELLKAAGYSLRELYDRREKGLCCGGNITTELLRPDTANKMAREIIDECLPAEISALATACPRCHGMLAPAGGQKSLPVMDIAELLILRI